MRALPRVVLGVGERAAKYDLRYPRTVALYAADEDEAQRLATGRVVAGAVVAGRADVELARRVLTLREAFGPTPPIAVVADALFADWAELLRRAGATVCGESWLGVQPSFGEAIAALAIPSRARDPRRLH